LRAYHGDTSMIGLEPTWEEHLAGLMAVFDEVWRVLRADGTLFVNYGDAYTAGGRGPGSGKQTTNRGSTELKPFRSNLKPRSSAMRSKTKIWNRDDKMEQCFASMNGMGPKNLMMMPARFALAMQERGWILRSEIVWAKKNCMPESVTDRPVSSHEKVFMFSRQKKYYYDHVAVRRPEKESSAKRYENPYNSVAHVPPGSSQHSGIHDFHNRRMEGSETSGTANMRNVLHLATAPYKGAHFATYPPALIEPFIRAGTSAHGVCPHCGAPWERVLEPASGGSTGRGWNNDNDVLERGKKTVQATKDGSYRPPKHKGWRPTCSCPDNVPVPATVMDIFAGSGTTGVVANRLGRNALLIEISPDYADMARKRLNADRFHALNYQKSLLDEIGLQ